MFLRLLRILAWTLIAGIVLLVVAIGIFYYHDQTTLAAHARATPQVPPEAAADQAEPVAVDLPTEVNVATANRLNGRDDVVILDIRGQSEYDDWHIPGAKLIPMGQLPERVDEVPRDRIIIVTCLSGRSSGQAVTLLQEAGFTDVHNMLGGMRAWDKAGFETNASKRFGSAEAVATP